MLIECQFILGHAFGKSQIDGCGLVV